MISNECSVEVSFRDINDFVCVCSVFLLHGRSDWRVPGGFFSVPWAFTSFHCATKGLTFDTVPECGRSRPLHIRVIAFRLIRPIAGQGHRDALIDVRGPQ